MPKSTVSLRIFGDELCPADITALLGCAPSQSYRKGDLISPNQSAATRKYGMWLLKGADSEPESFDQQIQDLLARLTPDAHLWQGLAAKFQVDLFCGYFMDETNQGFSLSLATVAALADRHVVPGFDLYAPDPEDQVQLGQSEA